MQMGLLLMRGLVLECGDRILCLDNYINDVSVLL